MTATPTSTTPQGTPSKSAKRDRSALGSRLVQAAFVLVLVGLWYLGTTYGKISRILLPNPVEVFDELVNVLATLEFVSDLRARGSRSAFGTPWNIMPRLTFSITVLQGNSAFS